MSYDRPRRGGYNQGYNQGGGDQHRGDRGGDRGHGGGGGGYQKNYRGGGNGEQVHQMSFVGKKRGRNEEPPEDPKKLFVSRLMTLCDPAASGSKADKGPKEVDLDAIEDAVKLVKRDIMHKNHTLSEVVELLLDCAAELSTKTHIYALLIGLLNVEDNALGAEVVSSLSTQLTQTLASPCPADHDRARLLLRVLACLASVNVVHPSAVVGLLEQMAGAALACAKSGVDPEGHSWQPWSDWVVYCILAVMPWAGTELSAACPAEVTRLCDTVEEYLTARPIQSDDDLKPFLQPIKEDDLAAKSDSGGASFLPLLWAAISASATAGPDAWRVEAVPLLLEGPAVESRLAVAQPHDLPEVNVPTGPPVPGGIEGAMDVDGDGAAGGGAAALAVRVAQIRKCYPPRGSITLLDNQLTSGGKSAADRFVVEEYILDTLSAFDVDRVSCIKVLSTGLPITWQYTPLLAEVLFGQILALPTSRLPLMAYSTIIVDLCKLPRLEFPRALSGCIRECFSRLTVIDPDLPPRLVALLSYHLSNFEFQWPWDRWEKYADEPEDNPHRQFCQQLVARMVRLSYYERVAKVLTPKFRDLLGPPPDPPELPVQSEADPAPGPVAPKADGGGEGANASAGAGGDDDKAQVVNAGGDAAMEDAGGQQGADGGAGAVEESMAVDGVGEGGAGQGGAVVSKLDLLAGQALGQVRAKASCEALLAWLTDKGVEQTMAVGPLGPLQVMMRALLAAGSKSPSHLHAVLERYAGALVPLLRMCPDPLEAQVALLQQTADFYLALPQKVLMVVDRLLSLRLITAVAVAHWSTNTAIPSTLSSAVSCSSAWELLHYAVERAAVRPHELRERRSRLLGDAEAAKGRAEELLNQAALTWSQIREHLTSIRAQATTLPPPPPAVPKSEDELKSEEPPTTTTDTDAAGAAAAVASLTTEQLAEEANNDQRGRRLLGAAKDADGRARTLLEKVEQITASGQGYSDAATAAVQEPQDALVVAYRGLSQLLAKERDAAAAAATAAAIKQEEDVEVKEEDKQGEEGGQDAEGEARARQAQVAANRVSLLRAQLRAFARRYAEETAVLGTRLADTLSEGEGMVTGEMVAVLREVLHADLLTAGQ